MSNSAVPNCCPETVHLDSSRARAARCGATTAHLNCRSELMRIVVAELDLFVANDNHRLGHAELMNQPAMPDAGAHDFEAEKHRLQSRNLRCELGSRRRLSRRKFDRARFTRVLIFEQVGGQKTFGQLSLFL